MKLLLVNAINQELPDRLHPPLGLAYLAASLRKEFGDRIECRIIDGHPAREIRHFQPDIVGITSVTRNYGIAKMYADIVKKAFDLPVIIGGVHVSALPETMTSDMDVAVIGEGEHAIIEPIASFLETGHLVSSTVECMALIKPLDNIPYPARDLLQINKHASMITSRGCPYNCAFCATSRHTNNQVRFHSAEYVAEEIEILYRDYKVEYITIYDDLFAMNKERIIKIHEALVSKNLIGKIDLAANIRADFITDEMAEIFYQMNFKTVAIGAESGCQKTLDYLKSGGITVEDNTRAVRLLKKHHIIPYCIFIVGSPYEDLADMMETLKFIEDNGINHFDINVLTPYPGTPVWEYALSRGLVSEDMDWSKLDFRITKEPILLSEKISRQEMENVLAKVERDRESRRKRRSIMNIIRHPYKYIIKPKLKRIGI